MSVDRILALKLVADVSSINGSLKKTEGRMKSFGRSAASWGKALTAGLVIQGIDMVGNALIQGVSDFREGEDAARNLGMTWDKLGEDGLAFAGVLEEISDNAVNMGFDDTESVKSYDKFLQMTRDSGKAMKLLAAAQDLARAEGISLEQAQAKVMSIFNGSARATRLYGVEGKKGMEAVNGAMKANKNKAKEWAKNHPIEVLSGKMSELTESIAGALIVPGMDALVIWLDEELTPAMTRVEDAAGELKTALSGIGIDIEMPDLSGVGATLTMPFISAIEGIEGLLDTFTLGVEEDWRGMFDKLFDIGWTAIRMTFFLPFVLGWELVKEGFKAFGIDLEKSIGDIFNNIEDAVRGFVDDFFKAAQSIGQGIANGLRWGINKAVGFVRSVLNSIIGLINMLDFSIDFDVHLNTGNGDLNKLVGLPAEGANFGMHTGDLIPDIAKLAEGGIVNRPTLALIGEAGREAVVPLDGKNAMGGNSYSITVNVPVNGDPAETGRKIVDAIKRYESRAGRSWRTA